MREELMEMASSFIEKVVENKLTIQELRDLISHIENQSMNLKVTK